MRTCQFRRLAALALIGFGVAACQLIDPILAADAYEVRADDKTRIAVEFKGGAGVSRLRQRDLVLDFMLDLSRDPTRDSTAFDAMLELESLFQGSGYPLAQVTQRIDRSDGVKVIFEIDQGPQVTVDKVVITGNTFIPRKELMAYWSRRQTDVLGLGDDLYVATEIEDLGKSIGSRYRRLGFLDATATPAPLVLTKDTKKISVTINVQEHTRYTLDAIEHDQRIGALLEGADLKRPTAGSPFIAPDIQNYALAVTQYLRRAGHADPQILTTIEPNAQTHTVRVLVYGDPGPSVTVSRIEVKGFGFVPEANIRKRIELEPGKRFDGKVEEDSVFRLYRSGLFRRVDVRHVADGEGKIAVVFEVEETTRYLIEPMLGWGSYEELRGGLEFEMLSLFGSGFDLSAKGTLSDKGYRVVTTISDSEFWPQLLGYDTTLSISADSFKREEPSYTDGAVGISPALSHIFSRQFSGRIAYIFREHSDAKSTVIDPGAMIGAYTEGSALIELTYDSRDNPLRPRSGSRVSAQYKYYGSALGGEVEFERVRFTGSTILPLSRSTRFVLRAETAWLTPRDGSDAIPIQERLFNGGESTVRSFREDKLAPLTLKDVNGQVVGGEFRNIANLEFRWAPPLQPLRSLDFELALFGDAGNLGRYADDYSLRDPKYAIGAGIRVLLPIGPLRFDYAHNPEPDVGDRSWTFHFSIGYPF